ncbi:MAG: Sjogren's syndrome/scleroderma autoantigen 1 family protein [Nitrososphaera sp.]|uniref:Sjogren's syndrome/scleroderma autoantigen 1 family protein n=1 Tax=Nitrososphaera sp. TaxID=1971748 RepID=UPI0017EAAD0B|nr:Sjogren's syndrome/scleroderma autoantigen 1 family protein [Nitrososphaera sp.]NWG37857.1 hypothetical protein [Nitrososphaera sp.]
MSAEDGSKIKSAASILLKGGTLVSEQCPKCGGVQVRFGGKTTCINCGQESKEEKPAQAVAATDSAAAIERRISALAAELADEKDLAIQKQKADLLETYLRILEKMRSLSVR